MSMDRYAIVIGADGRNIKLHCDDGEGLSLETLQGIVGGYIETVPAALAQGWSGEADVSPILIVNEEGKLIPREKVQGRRKSIRALADKVKQNIVDPEGQLVLISHGDCEAEAQSLADMIKAELPVAEVRLSYIGPIVGAHSGPGTLAVFFMGKGR